MQRTRELYQARVEKAIAYIAENLDQNLNLSNVARIAGFSPYHFHHIFSALLGETPQDYVNRLRIERAANLLHKMPSLPITRVALSCGFSSSATFARSFKTYYGMNASRFAACAHQGKNLPALTSKAPPPDIEPLSAEQLKITIQAMPAFHVAYKINYAGYSLAEICRTWERIAYWAMSHHWFTPASTRIGISYDDPLITPRQKCRYYACITIPKEITADPQVGILDIPSTTCAVSRVTCSAEQIELIYRNFYQNWLPDSGYEPQDYPVYEIYIQTPDQHPEGKYILDVCIPIKPV